MNKPLSLLLLCLPCLSACGTMKSVNKGVKWTYQKTAGAVSGAGRAVAGGARKVWPWSKKTEKEDEKALASATAAGHNASVPAGNQPPPDAAVAVASQTQPGAAAPNTAAPAPPPKPAFTLPPRSKLYVSDSDLGADQRIEENAKITLKEGWEVEGARVHYSAAFAGDTPMLLRSEGAPCRATKAGGESVLRAQAREMHYRQDTGILTLKGFPALQIGERKVTAAAGSTIIAIHLESGSFKCEGPVNTVGN